MLSILLDVRIDLKKLLVFTVSFILFTVVRTVSHELGHVAVDKVLGYKTFLQYGSMHYNNLDFTKTEGENTFNKQNLELKDKIKKSNSDNLLIIIGGPLQTISTVIIELVTILCRKEKIRKFGLQFLYWLAVFFALFWLREVFNLAVSAGSELLVPNGSYFGGDEKNISKMLDLPPGIFPILLGAIGLVVSTFIIFKIVPHKLQLSFILSGLIGGISGFILWMYIIGPKILP